MRKEILIKDVFAKLTVLEKHKTKVGYWLCQCSCGSEPKYIRKDHLLDGSTVSCGCHAREKAREGHTKHGLFYTREYNLWAKVKSRCENPDDKAYKWYGGRGIRLHKEWSENPVLFVEYLKLLSGYSKENNTLDRINNDIGYEPGNLRWSNRKIQAQNRSNNIVSMEQALIIRQRIANGERVALIASDFNIPTQHVYNIKNLKIWK